MSHTIHLRTPREQDDVSVNGVVIARDAIAREAQHHPAAQPIAALKSAARALVIRELLLQEAGRLEVSATPKTDEAGRRETADEAVIRCLVEQEVATPQADETACLRYYRNNRGSFRSPDIYEVAHILLLAPLDHLRERACATRDAQSIIAELAERPERFADLARARSACPSAAHGGNLGQIVAGQTTPEFERAVLEMEPGTISAEPVATPYGLHVIRLDRRIGGRDLPFELVATRIAEYLHESVTRRATAQYIARLVSRAHICGIEIEGALQHRVN